MTLPMDAGSGVTSSCQCQAAIPAPALPQESPCGSFLLLFLLNSSEGQINTRIRGCPELAQGIDVLMRVSCFIFRGKGRGTQGAPWHDCCRGADKMV